MTDQGKCKVFVGLEGCVTGSNESCVNSLPFVSVIVPTFRDWQRLSVCLQELGRQTYPVDKFEIIVVDNDGEEKRSSLPGEGTGNVIVLREPARGSDVARNTGIRAARGAIYAFTDSDCIPDREWLEKGVAFLLRYGDIDYIGGQVEVTFRDGELSWAEVYEKAFAFRQEEINKGRRFAVTANLMAWRRVFEAVGLFDGNVVTGGDWEWGNRASRMGYKIGYCEMARVRHPARHTLREIFRKRMRVSGGQYQGAKTVWYRLAIVLVGFLPPVVPMWKLRDRRDLLFTDKAKAVAILYVMRITRSVSFVLIGLSVLKPGRY